MDIFPCTFCGSEVDLLIKRMLALLCSFRQNICKYSLGHFLLCYQETGCTGIWISVGCEVAWVSLHCLMCVVWGGVHRRESIHVYKSECQVRQMLFNDFEFA